MPTLTIDFPLEEGEDNIVARLKSMAAYYGLAVPTIMPLGNSTEDEILRSLKKGPSMFVVFENDYFTQESELAGDTFQNGWRVWRVMVLSTSMRGMPGAARRGELGAYRLSDAAKSFLEGFDPVTNSDVDTNFPMLMIGRQNAPSEDLADYMMLMRFAHPIEATTNQ